jgi:hypothetical protein
MSGVNKPNNITIKRKSPNGSTYTYTLTNNRSGISKIRVNNNKTHKFSEAVVENITRGKFKNESNNELEEELNDMSNNNTNPTLLDEKNERILISQQLEKMKGLNKKSNVYKSEYKKLSKLIITTNEYKQIRPIYNKLFDKLYEAYKETPVTPEIKQSKEYKDFKLDYAKAAGNDTIDDFNILQGTDPTIILKIVESSEIYDLSTEFFNATDDLNKILPKEYQIQYNNAEPTNYKMPQKDNRIKMVRNIWLIAFNIHKWFYTKHDNALELELAELNESKISGGGTQRRKRQKKYKLRTAKRKIRRI